MTDGVSRRRIPVATNGARTGEVVATWKPKKGDRVARLGGTPRGIVRQIRKDKALVWWGTTDGREVTEWVPAVELELTQEPVVDADTVLQRMKDRSAGSTSWPGTIENS